MIAVIADQLKLFRHQLGKHVVFVGSDAIVQPYEATVEQLLERMALDWAADRVAPLPPDQRPTAALEAYAEAHPDHAERCADLAGRLQDLRPGEGHVQIARLIKDGYIALLFTMSPDDSLERALAAQKMVAGEDYHCVVAGSDAPEDIEVAVRQSTRVVVVKCGGDLHAHMLPLTQEEMAGVLRPLEDLVKDCFRRTVVFVAYAGRDRSLVTMTPRDGDRVYWVNRHIPVDDPKAVDDMRLASPDAEQYHKLQPEVIQMLAARHSSRNLLCREPGRYNEFFGRVYERLRRRRHRHHGPRGELSVLRGGPFKFLEAYDVHDAETFFAREEETDRLFELVQEQRLVTLFGQMGTGKTSLLRAGLIPRLRKESQDEADGRTEEPWLGAYVRCGPEPLHELQHDLALRVEEIGFHPAPIVDAANLAEAAARCREQTKHRVVFILDNAQELFLKLSQAARDEFASQAAALVADEGGAGRLVLGIREDYLGELWELSPALGDVLSSTLRLHRFTRERAEDAIVKPAGSFGIQFERDLVGRIVEDVDREGVLPAHLQIVCHRLLAEAGPGRTYISSMLYRRIGGARKILDEYVDQAVSQLPATDRRLAWQILRNLAGVSETLAAMPLNDLADQVRGSRTAFDRVLARLVDLRLLRLMDRDGVRYLELIHDLLAQDIRKTLATKQSVTAQSVHDILARGLDNYRLTGELLDRGDTHAVSDERDELTLTPQELDLVIRSAVKHDIAADYWLGRLGELREAAYKVLADSLASDDQRIRAQALKRSREHLGPSLIEPLARLADSDAAEKQQARDLLRSMEKDLVAALTSDDGDLRGWAVLGVAQVNGKRHLKDLVAALDDQYPSVTDRVAETLADVDPVGAGRLLVRSLRSADRQWATAEALGRLAQHQSVITQLHRAIAREPASAHLAYAYGVAQTRQRRYEEAVETLDRARSLGEQQGLSTAAVEEALSKVNGALARAEHGEDRWAMSGGAADHTHYVSASFAPPLREFWTANAGAEIAGGVVVAKGLVFAGLRDGGAVCLDFASGALRWQQKLAGRVEAAPALVGENLLLATADGRVTALDLDGETVMASSAGGVARAPLAVAGGLVLVGGRSGDLVALSAQDLAPRWRYQFGAEITAACSVRHGLVFAGSWDASVVALDLQTGDATWQWQGEGPVAGSVAAGEEMLAWTTDSGLVIAADPYSGEVLWETSLPAGSRVAPALGPDYLVIGCLDGSVRCLASEDGSLLWEFPTADQVLAPSLIVGDYVYVASRDGRLYALHHDTGERVWRYTTSYGIYATPALVEGVMFVVLRQRQVVAFVPEEEVIE